MGNPEGFYAVNPDPEVNDFTEIQWSLGQDSTIGSKMVIDGQGGKPSTFEYTPPDDFFGIDYFSLIMDEGDRTTELDFEVYIGEVPDPPRFETNLQNLYFAREGEEIELEVLASDIDSDSIQFRLVGPSWDVDSWLKLSQEPDLKKATLHGVPRVGIDGKVFPYTIFIIDDTGLVESRGITFEVEGTNSPPIIIPNEINILFSQNGDAVSNYTSITASDNENDLLHWDIIESKDAIGNELLVQDLNGSLPTLRFSPVDIRDSYGPFILEVSDGSNTDSISIFTQVNWDNNITFLGFESEVVIKEMQGFTQQLSLSSENYLATPKVTLISSPSWVEINEISIGTYSIYGIAPSNSAGEYTVSLEVSGDGVETQILQFDLQVVDPIPPRLELNDDKILRMSSLKPYVDPGYSAFDARGKDLQGDVNVSVGSVDDYGYQIINYSVLDEYENKVIDQRLVRHYEESPLVLSSKRQKIFSENLNLKWGSELGLSSLCTKFLVLEKNGLELNGLEIFENSLISVSSDFDSEKVQLNFDGKISCR